jgi:hypothetical protein
MNSNKLYSEIFQEFESASGKKKIEVLRKYGTKNFKNFLCCALHPNISFDIKQIPQYSPAVEPAGLNYVYLEQEMGQVYKYITNHPSKPAGLTIKRQMDLLVVSLSSLHKEEAKIYENMFMKKLDVKGLTPKVIKEAFPDLPF